MALNFEEIKPIVRPTGVHRGKMKFDADKCNSCGLCIENCPFRCLEMDLTGHGLFLMSPEEPLKDSASAVKFFRAEPIGYCLIPTA